MVVAEIRALPITSADDAIEEIWQRKMDTGCSLLEAAVELWPRCQFSSETMQMLALDGLEQRARDAKHLRGRSDANLPGIAWGAPHGNRTWHDYLNSLTHPYQGADATKPLYEFDRADLAAFAVSFRRMADGYLRRATWADEALAVMDEHGKDKIADLPAQALKQVAESASEAFGKQE